MPKVKRRESERELSSLGSEMLMGAGGFQAVTTGMLAVGRQRGGFYIILHRQLSPWLQERQTLSAGGSKPSFFSPASTAWESEGGRAGDAAADGKSAESQSPCFLFCPTPLFCLFIMFPKIFSAPRSYLYSPSTLYFFKKKNSKSHLYSSVND